MSGQRQCAANITNIYNIISSNFESSLTLRKKCRKNLVNSVTYAEIF